MSKLKASASESAAALVSSPLTLGLEILDLGNARRLDLTAVARTLGGEIGAAALLLDAAPSPVPTAVASCDGRRGRAGLAVLP